jgi:hypothetical protein
MKRILLVLGSALALAMAVHGQSTAVSATVTDTDGTAWANGTCTALYAPIPGSPQPLRNSGSGAIITPNPVSCNMDGSGAFSISLIPSANVFGRANTFGHSPGVVFTVCPQMGSPCYATAAIPIVGTTQSVSTQINAAIKAPRIPGLINNAQAYNDGEVAAVNGNQYTRLTDGVQRCYASSAWGNCGGSTYTLPIATTSVLGGVKPDGTTCTVNGSTGVLACPGSGGGPTQTCDASTVASYAPALCTVTLSSAQILAFDGTDATDVQAIVAPVSGKTILVTAPTVVNYIFNSTPYSATANVLLSVGHTVESLSGLSIAAVPLNASVNKVTSSAGNSYQLGDSTTNIAATPLYVNQNVAVTTGNGTYTVTIPYTVIPVS